LNWYTYPLPGDPGPVMLVFTAEPGGADADWLQVLASLHATRSALTDQAQIELLQPGSIAFAEKDGPALSQAVVAMTSEAPAASPGGA
jgi:hypothetical protein